jgi:hypothetical protein
MPESTPAERLANRIRAELDRQSGTDLFVQRVGDGVLQVDGDLNTIELAESILRLDSENAAHERWVSGEDPLANLRMAHVHGDTRLVPLDLGGEQWFSGRRYDRWLCSECPQVTLTPQEAPRG